MDNHPKVIPIVIVTSDKIHQRMLKFMGKSFGVKGTFALFQLSPPRYLLAAVGNSTYTIEKSNRLSLSQVVKVNTISSKAYCHCHITPPIMR